MRFPYPRKDAGTDKPLIDVIKQRWSPVAFSSEPIEEERIQTLFEAGRWSQSSNNEQPWRFIYATKADSENYKLLAGLLSKGNEYATQAYLLLLGCAVLKSGYGDRPINRHAQYDTGSAMNNIFLQAVGMGLVAHEMGGFDKEKAITALHMPEEVEPMAMMAIGYPGNPNDLSDKLKERQGAARTRKELSEIAFRGRWRQ